MLHQESRYALQPHDFLKLQTESLSMIAYRSRASSPPTDAALRQLVGDSQNRNRASGLTGVLVHENGEYFQWLEGPIGSLERTWASILRDPRHSQITVLREEPISERVFEDWDLRIAAGARVSIDAAVTAMDSSSAGFRRVVCRPESITDISLEDGFTEIVIPRLLQVRRRDARNILPRRSTGSIWHADADCGAKLAGLLLSSCATDPACYVDTLLEQGANLNALYREVFEPAQLQMGKLWDQDLCDDFQLSLGLARLQVEVRRVNVAMPAEYAHKPMHSVLLAAQPNEPHCVGLSMSSEVFDRQGWDVRCQFSGDDQALNDLLRTQWFDVLKLSQSGSLRRDGRLTSIRTTIDGARAASANPSLIVMVDGRTFSERPQIYRAVHANGMCVSAVDAAPTAERLLQANKSVTFVCLESVS